MPRAEVNAQHRLQSGCAHLVRCIAQWVRLSCSLHRAGARLLRCSEWGKRFKPILSDKVSLRCAWPSQVLLEGGANPNAQNSDGRTPLHLCMPAGFSACVVHLYNAGAGTVSSFYLSSIPHQFLRTRARALPIVMCVCARHNSIVARSVASQVRVTLRPSHAVPVSRRPTSDDTIKDRDGKTALDQTSEDFSPANL